RYRLVRGCSATWKDGSAIDGLRNSFAVWSAEATYGISVVHKDSAIPASSRFMSSTSANSFETITPTRRFFEDLCRFDPVGRQAPTLRRLRGRYFSQQRSYE
ncbi:MAG: hypothetical protein ABR591_11635, partial [Candidatus Velthaea sp.]